jgi:hypothetical protein
MAPSAGLWECSVVWAAAVVHLGAQAAAHRRWRGVGGAFRCAGGRTGAVHLITPAMAPARREAEAVRRDATRQPAGMNKEEGSRMDACGGCLTKCDARRRHATTGNATTSRRTRDKREERHQWTRGDGASIGQGCAFRGGGRVERMRGGGINATTSR